MSKKTFFLPGLALVLLALLLGTSGVAHVAADAFPSVISLPDGFAPEGVETGKGATLYAGSLATGSIYGVDLRTGAGEMVVSQTGRVAVGLAFDARSDYLFVAGGPTGMATVYDVNSGEEVAGYQLTGPGSFINDVFVTREAAYFTNSFQPVYYVVPLGPRGALPDASMVQTVTLSGDYDFVPGGFNANGIVATPDGKQLIIVNSTTGTLYLVAPETGVASAIDLGGASVPAGDGLEMVGHTLYVVQNAFNQVAVVELSGDYGSGEIAGTISSGEFAVPTTAAAFGNDLYVVNARFNLPPGPYTVVSVPRTP